MPTSFLKVPSATTSDKSLTLGNFDGLISVRITTQDFNVSIHVEPEQFWQAIEQFKSKENKPHDS